MQRKVSLTYGYSEIGTERMYITIIRYLPMDGVKCNVLKVTLRLHNEKCIYNYIYNILIISSHSGI